jgi:hypothetical protein
VTFLDPAEGWWPTATLEKEEEDKSASLLEVGQKSKVCKTKS